MDVYKEMSGTGNTKHVVCYVQLMRLEQFWTRGNQNVYVSGNTRASLPGKRSEMSVISCIYWILLEVCWIKNYILIYFCSKCCWICIAEVVFISFSKTTQIPIVSKKPPKILYFRKTWFLTEWRVTAEHYPVNHFQWAQQEGSSDSEMKNKNNFHHRISSRGLNTNYLIKTQKL